MKHDEQVRAPRNMPSVSQFDRSRLDEQALEELQSFGDTTDINDELLKAAPARDMRLKIEELILLLGRMDHHSLLKKQGWVARFTGADIEARLEFELASDKVGEKMEQLRKAADNARRALKLLDESRVDLYREQDGLERTIKHAGMVLKQDRQADDFIRSRYERRLSNLIALNSSITMTIEQVGVAMGVLKALIDRFHEVETTVFPLWQHGVLALAHATPGEVRQAGVTYAEIEADFRKLLKQD